MSCTRRLKINIQGLETIGRVALISEAPSSLDGPSSNKQPDEHAIPIGSHVCPPSSEAASGTRRLKNNNQGLETIGRVILISEAPSGR